jgi:predicted Ser/Thr protein kinase
VPTAALRPGDPTELGGYRLLGRLGEGGMGAVFLGESPDGRLVAVKAIRPELAGQDEFRARFRSEVSRARAVPSFCTAPVLDADPEHDTPYLVVEYVDGPSLAEVVTERGPLTGGDLHSVAIGVATALTAIHGAGVIHRDLKPRNVLFSLGTPKVIDFGIARAFEATSNHTRTDQMVGTVSYMAPERFDTDARGVVGPAADVFAWGVVVAYAGTGRTPFGADAPAATAARILTQPPDLRGLTSPLREIVARTLAKDPVERPTAAELLELLLDTGSHSVADLTGRPELRQAAQAARASGPGRPASEEADRSGTGRGSHRRRRRLPVVLAGVTLLALMGAGGAYALVGAPITEPTTAATVGSAAPALIGTGPLIIDRLDRTGQWTTARDQFGTCAFTGGRLVVSTGTAGNSCPGPEDEFGGDQAVAVTVALLKAGSCGAVGFRRLEDEVGYVLLLCADEVTVFKDADDTRTPLGTRKTAVLAGGGDHRVELRIRDEAATVTVDGARVAEAVVDDRRLLTGKVELGVETDGEPQAGSVAYQDVEIRTL